MKKIAILLLIIISVAGFFLFTYPQRKGLDNFYKLTKEDPLFYSSFFDEKAWKESTKRLQESENELKKAYAEIFQKGAPNATEDERKNYIPTLYKYDIYPHQLLNDLVSINKKTNEFLENPSQKLGKELLSLYDNAADAYIQNIDGKIKIMKDTKSSKKTIWPVYYFFIGSVSDSDVVLNDFQTIKENGLELKKEIEQRKKCLSGLGSCPPTLPEDNNKVNDFVNSFNAKFNPKNDNIGSVRDYKGTFLSVYTKSTASIKGPYMINSRCWKSADFNHWMYIFNFRAENGKILFLPKMATENYFYDRGIAPSFETEITHSNIHFQPEAVTYECLDSTFHPQLAVLDFLKNESKTEKINKEDLMKNHNYQLLVDNQFGVIAPIISSISLQLDTFGHFTSLDNSGTVALNNLFSVRSAYSIFFFPFARSIWRIDKKPQYFLSQEKNTPKPHITILTQGEVEDLGYSKERIKDLIFNESSGFDPFE